MEKDYYVTARLRGTFGPYHLVAYTYNNEESNFIINDSNNIEFYKMDKEKREKAMRHLQDLGYELIILKLQKMSVLI